MTSTGSKIAKVGVISLCLDNRIRFSGVAGTQVLAFVERTATLTRSAWDRRVAGTQVLAFVERPNCSRTTTTATSGVDGTQVLAFVERCTTCATRPKTPSVAGTQVLAFVERVRRCPWAQMESVVSPGLRSWPSLSVVVPVGGDLGVDRCRRDSGPGLR